ncbi:hypothetical protein PENTCL1PPCAC_27191, partial [Pristionchus entomophagus]
ISSVSFMSIDTEPQSKNVDEEKYLQQIGEILKNGKVRTDRTGTGTISIFGMQARYSLRDNTLPLLTTKKVFWKAVREELLWFISGCTDAKVLANKGVRIWDANGSREFLDNLGFKERREGDLGPVYGFQWRHFGAEYEGPDADYTGKGKDQLAEVINMIKETPDSRRIIMSAWNAADLDKMALPPCHTFSQFYVQDEELSCHLYQRSGDMGLGVPFNIASYALLTHMIAHVTGLKAAELVHTLGDAHIYSNHVEALKIQLERTPYEFPKLKLDESIKTIDDFRTEHIKMEGYKCHDTIEMKMAV